MPTVHDFPRRDRAPGAGDLPACDGAGSAQPIADARPGEALINVYPHPRLLLMQAEELCHALGCRLVWDRGTLRFSAIAPGAAVVVADAG